MRVLRKAMVPSRMEEAKTTEPSECAAHAEALEEDACRRWARQDWAAQRRGYQRRSSVGRFHVPPCVLPPLEVAEADRVLPYL